MKCKPGDLAIVVQCVPMPQAVGHVVECLEFKGSHLINGTVYADVWLVRWNDHNATEMTGYEGWGVPDPWLRPIRPNEGEDETLQWAGKPEGVTA